MNYRSSRFEQLLFYNTTFFYSVNTFFEFLQFFSCLLFKPVPFGEIFPHLNTSPMGIGSQVKLIPRFFNMFISLLSMMYVECASVSCNCSKLFNVFSIMGFNLEHILSAIKTSWTFKQYDVLYDVLFFILNILSKNWTTLTCKRSRILTSRARTFPRK